MATIESVTEKRYAAMLDELLWTVLWQLFDFVICAIC